ncbi:HTH-type transcriptional activator RhaS [compost metagenome]
MQDARIHQIAHFMEQRIDNPPSVAAAAHHIGVSVRQLERMFHLSLGVSPAAFQRRMRIKYGRWLLENSNKTVTEIAFDCGFADTAHFSREFRTHYQQSPSELRRNFNAR